MNCSNLSIVSRISAAGAVPVNLGQRVPAPGLATMARVMALLAVLRSYTRRKIAHTNSRMNWYDHDAWFPKT